MGGVNLNANAIYGAVIGGHVRNASGDGVSLAEFVNYATSLASRGEDGKEALIKFGKLQTVEAGQVKENLVFRTPSVEKDGLFACDIKNPLFRTSKTKTVNNDIRKTFLNALKAEYSNFNVKDLLDQGEKEALLEGFVGKRGVDVIRKAIGNYTLGELVALMKTNGTGKPISAREVLSLNEVVKNQMEVPQDQKAVVHRWGEKLREALKNEDEGAKIEQLKAITLNLSSNLSNCQSLKKDQMVGFFVDQAAQKLNTVNLPACIDDVLKTTSALKEIPVIKLIKATFNQVKKEVEDQELVEVQNDEPKAVVQQVKMGDGGGNPVEGVGNNEGENEAGQKTILTFTDNLKKVFSTNKDHSAIREGVYAAILSMIDDIKSRSQGSGETKLVTMMLFAGAAFSNGNNLNLGSLIDNSLTGEFYAELKSHPMVKQIKTAYEEVKNQYIKDEEGPKQAAGN